MKLLFKEVGIKFLELALGFIVGYMSYSMSSSENPLSGLISIVIGLLTTMIFTLIIESSRHSYGLYQIENKFNFVLQTIAANMGGVFNLDNILNRGTINTVREKIPEAWMQTLWDTEKRYWATSYISPEEGWDQSYTKLGLDIQRTKINVKGADIRRVFIIDTEEELEELRSVICEQINQGIKAKYIYKRDIDRKSMMSTLSSTLESLDFGIVDENYVSLVFVDRKRKISYGQCHFGKEVCQQYQEFHTLLFEEATTLEC